MVKKYLIFLWLLVFTGGLGNIVSCGGNGSGSGSGSDIGDLRISTQNLYLGTDLGPIVVAANAATAESTAAVAAGATAESIPAAAEAAAEAAATAAAAAGATEATIAAAVGAAIATAVGAAGVTATPAIVGAVGAAVGALAAVQTAFDNALEQILANDIGSRAVVIAKIIARDEPDVIGLQEVSTFTLPGGAGELNFLRALRSALTLEGLSYKVAVEAKGADITVPTSRGMVSYKNSDVILVEDSLQVSDKEIKAYEASIPPITVAGTVLSFPRSYARVTLQREGASPFVVVNTHLEANPANPAIGALQALQLGQLQTVLTAIEGPVFLIGDLNSFAPDTGVVETGATSTSYEALIDAGFTDSYLEANPATETTANSTCCYNEVLDITVDITTYGRVDHILYRGEEITPSQVRFTGNEATDQARVRRTGGDTKIWPSDHLGVVGTFPGDL